MSEIATVGLDLAKHVFQSRGVGCPLRHDLPELTQMAAKRIDRLRPLPDQQLTDAEHHGSPLGLFALHGHEAHRRAHGRFADRLGIGSIVLLPLHERSDVGRRDQP